MVIPVLSLVLSLLSSVSKDNKYVVVLQLGLLLLSFVSKHNMWSYYGWFCGFCRPTVNTTCGRNKVGFVVFFVHQ